MPTWLAPAKLNLFLHVIGRREDGYHLLQTVFQFIDFYDRLEFLLTDNGEILQARPLPGISEEQDLAVLAAKALQRHTNCQRGVEIAISKCIPTGAGLGGGSSNAATTLLALNQLWNLNLSREELAEIGQKLGADIPVFVHGYNAWAEGIGEQLTPIELEQSHFVVVIPPVHVSTAEIFAHPKLTRDVKPIKIRDFLTGRGSNGLQKVTSGLYPQVKDVLDWLGKYGEARMSGSGAAVFMAADSARQATQIVKQCPLPWQAIYARGLAKHPLG